MNIEKVEIKKLGINGEGIGYIDRKIIFIKGALIDEEVEVEITNRARSFYEGKLLKVITPSKERIVPICRNADQCLGCSLLHLKYNSQLMYKKEAIRESIRKYTKYNLDNTVFKDVIASDTQEGFISSVNVPIVEFNRKITFGIYQRESKYLTLLTHCFKQDPRINVCLQSLEKILTNNQCRIYNDKFRTGLRFLKIKCIDGKLQLLFVTGRDGIKEEVMKQITAIENVVSVFTSVNTSKYQEFEELGYSKIFGNTRLELPYLDKKYLISIKSSLPENINIFFKKNQEILKLLEQSQSILSINSGIGILELMSDKKFTALEEKQYYNEDAKLNLRCLRKENITFIKGDIDEKIVSYAKKKEHDTFLIQNGRFGLSDAVKESILLSKVGTVIYSCETHSTLAKDLADLQQYYNLEKIVALDSFVYTPYVTTIVKLKRK